MAKSLKVLDSLKKQIPAAFEYDDQLQAISTGSIAVDLICGIGGFPRKRVSEVFGWESSGKTTLCLQSCAQAQKDNLAVAYIDMERGVDLSLAKRIGYRYDDPATSLFLTPTTFEDAVRATHDIASSGEVDLIILDSVPAMVPASEMEGDIDAVSPVAARARALATFLPRITKTLAEKNVALVLVNQMRQRIAINKFDRGPSEVTTGGSALRFYSSLRIDMDQVRRSVSKRKAINPLTGKEEEIATSSLHRATAFKSKVAVPYRSVEFYIRYDPVNNVWGIDNLQSIIDLAVTREVIELAGSRYKFKHLDEALCFSAQGSERLYSLLSTKPELLAALKASLGVS